MQFLRIEAQLPGVDVEHWLNEPQLRQSQRERPAGRNRDAQRSRAMGYDLTQQCFAGAAAKFVRVIDHEGAWLAGDEALDVRALLLRSALASRSRSWHVIRPVRL